jgi:hypothetical protein
MDSSNHWYGHAHILARFCGLGDGAPPRINGVIQHGWTFVHGFGFGHQPPEGFARFAWSDVCRRRGQAIGWRDYYVIGAPFLYLAQMDPEPQLERKGTIWYPFHGTPDYESLVGDHSRLIDEIKEVETGPVTVCLYFIEYEQQEVRRRSEDEGFRVICHGSRGAKWRGGSANFLDNQLAELRRHERVASNRLSTAIFYGTAMGCEPAVYGDPMELVGVKEGFNGERLLEAWYPELHGQHLDLQACREIADEELGRQWLLSPDEMVMVLGWSDQVAKQTVGADR